MPPHGDRPSAIRITAEEVQADLEAGRSRPLHRPTPLTLQPLPRPTLGGPAFRRTYLTALTLGHIHPRLARPALARLWLTPWVHPSALHPVELPPGLRSWSLDVADRTLRGYTGGAGPTVVLVHGWAGRAADWRHLAIDLAAAGWRVVTPDLPAHGTTTGTTTTVFELSDALAAVLRRERPVAVVAHSLGFPVLLHATRLALATPPASIVAVAPGRRMRHTLQRFAERSQLPPDLADELRRSMQRRFGADIWDALDADRQLPDLSAQGLVIHDADDADVAIADGEAVARQWPGATFVTTRGLGHRRILRDPGVRRCVVEALDPRRTWEAPRSRSFQSKRV